jgi:hypothetical protein
MATRAIAIEDVKTGEVTEAVYEHPFVNLLIILLLDPPTFFGIYAHARAAHMGCASKRLLAPERPHDFALGTRQGQDSVSVRANRRLRSGNLQKGKKSAQVEFFLIRSSSQLSV